MTVVATGSEHDHSSQAGAGVLTQLNVLPSQVTKTLILVYIIKRVSPVVQSSNLYSQQ